MFSGFQNLTIDIKGRIKFPAHHHRQILDLDYQEKFILPLHPGEICLVLYPFENWSGVTQAVNQLPMGSHAQLIKRRVVSYATEYKLDANNCILVSE